MLQEVDGLLTCVSISSSTPSPYRHLSNSMVSIAQQSGKEKINRFFENYGLSGLGRAVAAHWIKKAFEGADDDLERVRPYLLTVLNGRHCTKPISPWQKGCPEVIPNLTATGSWDTSLLPCISEIEAAFPVIKEELLSLRGLENTETEDGFQPYRSPVWSKSVRLAKDGVGSVGHDAGNWNVYYLFLHNVDFKTNRSRCPKTVELLSSMERGYDHAFFSTMAPSTHITPHHGPTNKKLRVHLPLIVPEGECCRLRVGDEMLIAKEGKCYVFDDSLHHEAWNDHPTQSRVVLIFDIWHPDLSKKEIKFLSFLRKAKMTLEKRICDEQAKEAALQKTVRQAATAKKKAEGMADTREKTAGRDGEERVVVVEEDQAEEQEEAFVENENFFNVIDAGRKLHPTSNDLWGDGEV